MKVKRHRKTHKEIWDQAYAVGIRDGKFQQSQEHKEAPSPKDSYRLAQLETLGQITTAVSSCLEAVSHGIHFINEGSK